MNLTLVITTQLLLFHVGHTVVFDSLETFFKNTIWRLNFPPCFILADLNVMNIVNFYPLWVKFFAKYNKECQCYYIN